MSLSMKWNSLLHILMSVALQCLKHMFLYVIDSTLTLPNLLVLTMPFFKLFFSPPTNLSILSPPPPIFWILSTPNLLDLFLHPISWICPPHLLISPFHFFHFLPPPPPYSFLPHRFLLKYLLTKNPTNFAIKNFFKIKYIKWVPVSCKLYSKVK